jgi:hypothetical protein
MHVALGGVGTECVLVAGGRLGANVGDGQTVGGCVAVAREMRRASCGAIFLPMKNHR